MATTTPIFELDPCILLLIRRKARSLARTCSLPGMDADDIAQELALDLWRRRGAFDPGRASFRTFADRVIARRIASLTASTAQRAVERRMIWLDEPIAGSDGATFAETLADPAAPDEVDLALTLDARRFVTTLSPAMLRTCRILLAPHRGNAAAECGLHRGSVYENLHRLRLQAEAAGLQGYVAVTPTNPPSRRYIWSWNSAIPITKQPPATAPSRKARCATCARGSSQPAGGCPCERWNDGARKDAVPSSCASVGPSVTGSPTFWHMKASEKESAAIPPMKAPCDE